jgi:Zn-dependent peptidase ImmA (M78 family)
MSYISPSDLFSEYTKYTKSKKLPTFPVDHKILCELVGVTYKEQMDTHSVLGRFVLAPENMEIRIARSQKEEHKRYLTAHMLGHLVLDLEFLLANKFYTESIYPRSDEPYRSKEDLADAYARVVLMPEKELEKFAKKFVKDNPDLKAKGVEILYEKLIEHLALLFGVDFNIIARRSVEIGLVAYV